MKKLLLVVGVLLGLLATASPAGAVTIWAAGDIGENGGDQALTAALIPGSADWVMPLGDISQETGAFADYTTYYDPTWGVFNSKVKPVPGNHDYINEPTADGFRQYFGLAAAPAPLWYSFTQAGWLIVVLDSEQSIKPGTDQYNFLSATLAANTQGCIMAAWHRPRFVSTTSVSNYGAFGNAWKLLYQYHADLVLNGHAHVYERFAKQDNNQTPQADGIREIVSGTGGGHLMTFGVLQPNSEVQLVDHGVLKLVLTAGQYTSKWFNTTTGTASDTLSNIACNA